jgi:muconate cycloisomerase
VKIAAVEGFPVSIVVRPDLAIVSAAGEHRVSRYVIVVVRTDEGLSGIGEANVVPVWSGESQTSAVAAIRDILGTAVAGRDPMQVSALADAMDRALIGNPFTKAAVEMALLDLTGKILNAPVHVLLGGARRPPQIPLKFSIGAFAPADAARVAETAVAMGLRACKVKVGTDVAEDLARVEAVRSAVGADFRVGVDANGGWTESQALSALSRLERFEVNTLEQPLRRGDFRGCARLRARTSIPIMLDESVFTPQDALEAIRADACDILSIYPGKNGGLRRSMEIAAMAAAAGLECVIGSNLEWEIGSAAMLHLAVAIPNLSQQVDHDIIGPLYHTRCIATTPMAVENGCAILPAGTGLGVEFHPSPNK